MQHGMVLIDLLGRIQLANQQAARFLLGDANVTRTTAACFLR
jgi:hypothetical protein